MLRDSASKIRRLVCHFVGCGELLLARRLRSFFNKVRTWMHAFFLVHEIWCTQVCTASTVLQDIVLQKFAYRDCATFTGRCTIVLRAAQDKWSCICCKIFFVLALLSSKFFLKIVFQLPQDTCPVTSLLVLCLTCTKILTPVHSRYVYLGTVVTAQLWLGPRKNSLALSCTCYGSTVVVNVG